MSRLITSQEYETALKQWSPKIYKMSQSYVPYMDQEDVQQELRLVLYKCLQRYELGHGTIFHTYLHRAMANRLGTLAHNMTSKIEHGKKGLKGGKHNPPPRVIIYLSEVTPSEETPASEGDIRTEFIKEMQVEPEDSLVLQAEMLGFKDLEVDWVVGKVLGLTMPEIARLAKVTLADLKEAKKQALEKVEQMHERGEVYASN